MSYSFQQLIDAFEAYRSSVDAIFTIRDTSATEARQYCLNVLLATSQMYANYVSFVAALPSLYRDAKKAKDIDEDGSVEREMTYRRRYEQALTALPWDIFCPSALSIAELNTPEDYIDSLTLHLPEIYEETLRMQVYAVAFMQQVTSPSLTGMEIGMEHLGNNHAIFVLPALQGAIHAWGEG